MRKMTYPLSISGERRRCFFVTEARSEIREEHEQPENEIDTLSQELHEVLEDDRLAGLHHQGDVQDLYDEIDSIHDGLWHELQPLMPNDLEHPWMHSSRPLPNILQELGRMLQRYGVIGDTRNHWQTLIESIVGRREERQEDEFEENEGQEEKPKRKAELEKQIQELSEQEKKQRALVQDLKNKGAPRHEEERKKLVEIVDKRVSLQGELQAMKEEKSQRRE